MLVNMFSRYSFLQWSTFFMTYCIMGWLFECTYCSVKTGKILNRGFCHGPWLPIYGTGATLFVLLSGLIVNNIYSVFLFGVIGGSVLELVTGFTMYHLFKVKYWDYSDTPLNFKGYISLPSSIMWGFVAVFVDEHLQPFVESMSINWSEMTFVIINTVLYTLFIEDLLTSVIAAIDLRNRLTRLAETSKEAELIRKSIVDIRTKLGDARQEVATGLSEMKDRAQASGIASAKATIDAFTPDYRSTLLKQSQIMEEKLKNLQQERKKTAAGVSVWSRIMLTNNPGAKSDLTDLEEVKKPVLSIINHIIPIFPFIEKYRESFLDNADDTDTDGDGADAKA